MSQIAYQFLEILFCCMKIKVSAAVFGGNGIKSWCLCDDDNKFPIDLCANFPIIMTSRIKTIPIQLHFSLMESQCLYSEEHIHLQYKSSLRIIRMACTIRIFKLNGFQLNLENQLNSYLSLSKKYYSTPEHGLYALFVLPLL